MKNCLTITERLLELINIKYTKSYLKDNILSHPDYPSLLSIADTFNKYKIKTMAVKIDFNRLIEMPLPCLVQTEINNQSLFYVINNVTDNEVSYSSGKKKFNRICKDEFLKIWTGVTLLVEKSENSKELNIEKKVLSKRIYASLILFTLVLFTSWIIISFFNSELGSNGWMKFFTGIYTLIKIAGLIVSIFLLWFEIDQHNPILQNFCSSSNKKINCNAVLNSRYANYFNDYASISLLCFSYFFSTLLCAFFYSFSASIFTILGIFSLISSPFVLTSIYYQAIKIKQWCKFCIIIQILLISEIVITFSNNFYSYDFQYETVIL